MSRPYDVIVAGLGAMGGAACDQLAGRGLRVLGLDRYAPPHVLGSSHGESRIIREAYFEDPRYVPLVRRAYECWSALERDTGRALLRITGGLMLGPPEGVLVSGVMRSAETHGLPYQRLRPAEVRRRFPAFAIAEPDVAIWEPRAGVLDPEACVTAQLERAARRGAELRPGVPAIAWRARGAGVEVDTPRGTEHATHLVLATGAWLSELLKNPALPLTIERMAVYWFEPAAHPEWFAPERFPIWIWEHEPGRFFYGSPRLGRGIKAARHHEGDLCTLENVRREVSEHEAIAMRELLERHLPDAAGPLLGTATCLYANTPDHDFVIDRHPDHQQVLIVSACSGHGFKFAGVIGEVIADLVIDRRSNFDLAPFRLSRFAGAGAPGRAGSGQAGSGVGE